MMNVVVEVVMVMMVVLVCFVIVTVVLFLPSIVAEKDGLGEGGEPCQVA